MPSDRNTLRRLAEALLNATLMLVALILLLAVVLVVQLRGLGSDLRADLAGMQARGAEVRAQAQAAVEALDAVRGEGGAALPDELARARDELAAIAGDPPAGTPGVRGDRTLLHRMLLAAVAAAAHEAQAPQP